MLPGNRAWVNPHSINLTQEVDLLKNKKQKNPAIINNKHNNINERTHGK